MVDTWPSGTKCFIREDIKDEPWSPNYRKTREPDSQSAEVPPDRPSLTKVDREKTHPLAVNSNA
ncbi:uncharacterized protein CIMG_09519 [Coccidioides immitis RS]|uniref:Uncharacterized protein n=1 Tax=Coccidioides immitis (strain RS) TaxID=246410 RepID=J3K2J5_COCIM|nr:uncharacterized protein CIMG_09519 [Coccidioides immitis RS]EAS28315.3 hypothetical protein CIMG_09519 [Coccidioides immitis RS]